MGVAIDCLPTKPLDEPTDDAAKAAATSALPGAHARKSTAQIAAHHGYAAICAA